MRGRPKASICVSATERDALAAFAGDSSAPPALALRARIVRACARGLSNRQVAAELQVAEHTVAKWRARFLAHRLDGLRDLPRSGALAATPASGMVGEIIETIRGGNDADSASGADRPDDADGTNGADDTDGAGDADGTDGGEAGRALPIARGPVAQNQSPGKRAPMSAVARAWGEQTARDGAPTRAAPVCAPRPSPRVVGLYLDAEHRILALAGLQKANASPAVAADPVRATRPDRHTDMHADNRGFFDPCKTALLSSLGRMTQKAAPAHDRLGRFIQALHLYPAGMGIAVFAYRPETDYSITANPFFKPFPAITWHSMARSNAWATDLAKTLQHVCANAVPAQPIQFSDALLQAITDYAEKNPFDISEEGFSWIDAAHRALPSLTAHREKPALAQRFFSSPTAPFTLADDLELAFSMAPIGLLVARQRIIEKCNQTFCGMFGYDMAKLGGKSLEMLYPSPDEYRHIGECADATMRKTGFYSDERIMRRIDGSLFWCRVSGKALDRSDPFVASVWTFEDISSVRPVTAALTPRERQIVQLLVYGKSSKQIAKNLNISHRTVESHRARLMRKYSVGTASELIVHLAGGRAASASPASFP